MKRWDIINYLIKRYNLTSYLEIGVYKKECFNKVECKLKHCVDPNFPANFNMTSDDFFNNCEWPYDIIFIDGLHTAEQAYKDIINAYDVLSVKGFIVVHDCNPAAKWHTRPPEEYTEGEEWNGTTYQGFVKFRKGHPELTCFTVDTDYGCGVITNRIDKPIEFTTWENFDRNRVELLGLIGVDEFKEII